MRPDSCRRLLSGSLCLAAVLSAWSCGSGGETEDEFPDIKGTYGGLAAYSGSSYLRWLVAFPERHPVRRFGGNLQRVQFGSGQPGLCTGQGTIAGEIATDRTIRFQLTQERWATCTARGPVPYTGTITSGGELDASGSVALQCDDGSTVTVQDHLHAELPRLPGP